MPPERLPPGRAGLPLLGETLAFLRNGFEFVESRAREHGPVFRTRILGRDTAVIVGPDACALWIDPELIKRDGSRPSFFFEILAGPSLPHLDGDAHRGRKTLLLHGFTRDALASYLPRLLAVVGAAATRWAAAGEFAWIPSSSASPSRASAPTSWGSSPSRRPAPSSANTTRSSGAPRRCRSTCRGRRSGARCGPRDRMLERFAESIRRHQERPGSDGLSRILAAALPDGTRIDPDALKRELHHIIIAGYIIFAEFAWAARELHRRPDLRGRLEAEVRGAGSALSVESLDGLPLLGRGVMEVKRLTPILPVIFGVAKKTFEFGGCVIPEGWSVLWGLRSTHLDRATWPDPETFDPDRFARGEHLRHPHAYVPQGPGPAAGHRCPGVDYATLFIQAFLVVLLREGYAWDFPSQDIDFNWRQIPPEPRSGLRVRFSRPAR
jgi:cytochrome P450